MKTWIPETTLKNGAMSQAIFWEKQKNFIMKNAKYLVAIAAFAALAFVGFSAFTSTQKKYIEVNGVKLEAVDGTVKFYQVGRIDYQEPILPPPPGMPSPVVQPSSLLGCQYTSMAGQISGENYATREKAEARVILLAGQTYGPATEGDVFFVVEVWGSATQAAKFVINP
jgi:hypothetical protein